MPAVGWWVLLAALLLTGVVGLLLRARDGRIRVVPGAAPTGDATDGSRAALPQDVVTTLQELGLRPGHPAVLHFSATWCGPCVAVRRVVGSVTASSGVADVEVDTEQHPRLRDHFEVLSLPTTVLLDAAGTARARVFGVPGATALREAVAALERP